MTPTTTHRPPAILLYAGVFVLAGLVLPWIGAERLHLPDILAFARGDHTVYGLILFQQRVPRVLLALVVGGALATTGATLQVLFRNPLAEPWTLGVSGGAALGAFMAQTLPGVFVAVGPLNSTQSLALLGAMLVMALVLLFSRRPGAISTHTLLLAGVTISVISGGLMMLVTYFVSPFAFVAIHRWMMGGLDVVGYGDLLSFLMLGLPGLLILASRSREYNHLALGEDMALGHGVNVMRVQRLTFVGAGLTTAACVAIAGPIAFVGMIIPHVVRRLSGFDSRVVLPATFLLGGASLAACDAVARTVLAPTELPVGVITAVLGGPVFLYLLTRR
ncbi:MAG: iron ABC transporter permease [Candidatus Eisenbacteria bacterium]|jgi:iron complex transport system permease protein|nr:iron ABC transporter permease [Candidatus Eisenbacteria bacterium]